MKLHGVRIAGVGLLTPAGIGVVAAGEPVVGKIPGFRARDHVPDRKQIKLMTRAVQVGMAGVKLALDATPGWQEIPPARRGLYIGARPQLGDPQDLALAMERSRGADGQLDLAAFGEKGMDLIHPLWLVRGLSNNVLGFASAAHDFQGTNANYCDGARGGWTAVVEGARAVAEGRADLVVAGAADDLVGMEVLFGGTQPGSEGAGFVSFVREEGATIELPDVDDLATLASGMGELGVARWPIAWCGLLVK
jgi:3-oxoacyl-(acyl-carrier-protein) synthase